MIPCSLHSLALPHNDERDLWSWLMLSAVRWTQVYIFSYFLTLCNTLVCHCYVQKRYSTTCIDTLLLVTACLTFPLQCIPYMHIVLSLSLWYTSFLLSVLFWPWNCLDINNFHPSSIRWWSDDIRAWDGNSNCTLEKNTALGKLCRSWCSFVWEQRITFVVLFCNSSLVKEERLTDLSRKRIIIPFKIKTCLVVTI